MICYIINHRGFHHFAIEIYQSNLGSMWNNRPIQVEWGVAP